MSDEEPTAHLTFSDREQDMTRRNSALFMHIGQLAMYDHIYVTQEEANMPGAYIFRHSEAFPILRDFMAKNHFVMHLNLTEVADCDMHAFDMSLKQQMTDIDHIPDDFI